MGFKEKVSAWRMLYFYNLRVTINHLLCVGTTGQYVNRIIKKQDSVVNKTFVQMPEAQMLFSDTKNKRKKERA